MLSSNSPCIAWNRHPWWSIAFKAMNFEAGSLFIPSIAAYVSSLLVLADCWATPSSSKISAGSSTSLAPYFISWWQPWLWGLTTGPGTANTSRFGARENYGITQSIESLIGQQGSNIVTGDGQLVLIEQSTHSAPEWHPRPLILIGHASAFLLNWQYITSYEIIFVTKINDDCV